MSRKKNKAKKEAIEACEVAAEKLGKALGPVTLKELAQANERVSLCEQAFAQTRAQAQAVVEKSGTRLQAARNERDELTARAKEQEAK